MFRDVRQRFLRDAEHRERAGAGDLREARVGRAHEARAQAGARRMGVDPRRQRADHACVERRRVALVDQPAIRVGRGVERLLRQRQRAQAAFRRIGRQPRLNVCEREAGSGQFGAEPVVHDGTGRVQLSFTVED